MQRAKHPTVERPANPTGQGSGLNGLKVGLAVAVVCMPGGLWLKEGKMMRMQKRSQRRRRVALRPGR